MRCLISPRRCPPLPPRQHSSMERSSFLLRGGERWGSSSEHSILHSPQGEAGLDHPPAPSNDLQRLLSMRQREVTAPSWKASSTAKGPGGMGALKAPPTKSPHCNLPSDGSRIPPWSWGTLKAYPGPSLSESELGGVEDVVQEASGCLASWKARSPPPVLHKTRHGGSHL